MFSNSLCWLSWEQGLRGGAFFQKYPVVILLADKLCIVNCYNFSLRKKSALFATVIQKSLSQWLILFFFSVYTIYTFSNKKTYSHQVLIYLNIPGIPVRKPLQNRQIVS